MRAIKKAQSKVNEQGLPVHSFQSLLQDLATLAKHRVRTHNSVETFETYTVPTAVQKKAFELLGIDYRL
ncbi:MAG: hypothetical protein ACP5T7_08905 [bacterium]